jgi:hypothetical protein
MSQERLKAEVARLTSEKDVLTAIQQATGDVSTASGATTVEIDTLKTQWEIEKKQLVDDKEKVQQQMKVHIRTSHRNRIH